MAAPVQGWQEFIKKIKPKTSGTLLDLASLKLGSVRHLALQWRRTPKSSFLMTGPSVLRVKAHQSGSDVMTQAVLFSCENFGPAFFFKVEDVGLLSHVLLTPKKEK